jgi:phage virion morphogenesis protein
VLIETTKQRFETSTSPDGQRWAPNTETTFLRLLGKYKNTTLKDGRINASGARRLAGKKPLIGETRALSTTINYRAGSDFLEIGSPMAYAGVHQFGAKARSFTGGKTPWGDVPARPFLGLSTEDQATIVDKVQARLAQAARGE